MLLSMDRVLRLLAEGKSVEKIAELAGTETTQVVEIIENVRRTMLKYEKDVTRKKVKLKKKKNPDGSITVPCLAGADFTTIPLNSSLIMNVTSYTERGTGRSSIGLVVSDKNSNTLGKVSAKIGLRKELAAEFIAIKRALEIGEFFQAKEISVRFGSEQAYNLLTKRINTENIKINEQLDEIEKMKDKFIDAQFQLATQGILKDATYWAKEAMNDVDWVNDAEWTNGETESSQLYRKKTTARGSYTDSTKFNSENFDGKNQG